MTAKSVKRQREEYEKAGLVQISAWVPRCSKWEILEDCKRLRREHLEFVGYYERDRDES